MDRIDRMTIELLNHYAFVIHEDVKKLTDREILQDAGKISHKIACDKAITEFEKYRIIQDKLYESDFDKYLLELEEHEQK